MAIRTYEHRIAQDKYNPKKLFSYVNRNKPVCGRISAMKDNSGKLHTDGPAIANILNEQFKSAFSRECPDLHLPIFANRTDNKVQTVIFRLDSIQKEMERLNKYKAPGIDLISPFVLHECASSFSTPF